MAKAKTMAELYKELAFKVSKPVRKEEVVTEIVFKKDASELEYLKLVRENINNPNLTSITCKGHDNGYNLDSLIYEMMLILVNKGGNNITSFDFSGTQFVGNKYVQNFAENAAKATESFINFLIGCKKITKLILSETGIGSDIIELLRNVDTSELEYLDLSKNDLTDDVYNAIFTLVLNSPELKFINLQGTGCPPGLISMLCSFRKDLAIGVTLDDDAKEKLKDCIQNKSIEYVKCVDDSLNVVSIPEVVKLLIMDYVEVSPDLLLGKGFVPEIVPELE